MNFEDVPVATASMLHWEQPGDPIEIHSGNLSISRENNTLNGLGDLTYKWTPRPRARLRLTPFDAYRHFDLGEAQLTAEGFDPLPCYVNRISESVEANVDKGLWGHDAEVDSVVFCVPNFHQFHGTPIRTSGSVWSGRAVLISDDWKITLDSLSSDAAVHNYLKETGGYAVTHIGVAERVNGQRITPADAAKLRETLFWFLSFCRGQWTGAVLQCGRRSDGTREWIDLASTKISSWRPLSSWCQELTAGDFPSAFPGFLSLFNQPSWRDPLTLAIHWYVEANMCAGGIEGGLVLAQATLEMLAWHVLVEEKEVCSENGFYPLPAEDKLRWLLSDCRIPMAFPDKLSELQKRAKAFNWPDGPKAITQIRNGLTHGQPKQLDKELKETTRSRFDAWQLALHYLELVILRLFGYHGRYFNNVKRPAYMWEGPEQVPWS